METPPVSTANVSAARTPPDAPRAAEAGVDPAAGGAEAFMVALLAQGMVVPAAPAAVAAASTDSGNLAPGTAQVLPFTRPLLAALLPATRRGAGTADGTPTAPDNAVAGAVDEAVADGLDDAFVGLRSALAAGAGERAQAGRQGEAVATSAAAPAGGFALAADFSAVRDDGGATGEAMSGSTTAHGSRAIESGTPAQLYGARHAALPLAEPALFAERLNQQISVMLSQHSQQARIAVSPPELGPVEVRVVIKGDEATVHLAAPHAATREALEDALPRLRAAFADSGLTLGDASVFTDMPQRQQQDRGDQDVAGGRLDEATEALVERPPVRMAPMGLVDAFV